MPIVPTSMLDRLKRFGSRFGYNKDIGPMGSVTFEEDRSNPLAVTANPPGFPGFVRVPAGQELSPEDIAHEGSHVKGGFTEPLVAELMARIGGAGRERGLIGLDEIQATLAQPDSPKTESDINVINQMLGASQSSEWYKKMAQALVKNRRVAP